MLTKNIAIKYSLLIKSIFLLTDFKFYEPTIKEAIEMY